MSAAYSDDGEGINTLKDLFDGSLKDKGTNIIKILFALKSGWVDAGKAAGDSAGLFAKAFSALKAGWGTMSLFSKGAVIVSAIAAIVAIVDKLHVSAAEATENMNTAFDEYNAAKGKEKTSCSNLPHEVYLEVPPRFELGNEGFADLCLTTWPRYRL